MATDNNNNIMGTINELLKDPEAVNKITDLLSSQGSEQSVSNSAPDPEMMARLSKVAASMADKSDPKINLLYALKPYMNQTRSQHIEKAIKMLQMTKITGLFKDL